ncbi:hypothetical protein PR048_004562 [Dryococelus australis]|uniref:Uncharacterized protein n=1 Tax=Dryococelus australis TaxID=614101 RepID=A0ABQ9I673_9NEOP|nr:hypothetical protein PR048_004562 [Dryococelus australis]
MGSEQHKTGLLHYASAVLTACHHSPCLTTVWSYQLAAIGRYGAYLSMEVAYWIKTQCETVSDEEMFKQDMERLFHNSVHQDFGDLEECEHPPPPSPQPTGGAVADDNEVALIDDCLYQIHGLHSQIVSYTICDWLAVSRNKNNIVKFDHLSPWLERCQIFNSLIEGVAPQQDANLDQELYTSYLLMISVVVELTEGGTLGKHLSEDFYTASNITEAVSIIPILKTLLHEVNLLLAEWPENPILVQIPVPSRAKYKDGVYQKLANTWKQY